MFEDMSTLQNHKTVEVPLEPMQIPQLLWKLISYIPFWKECMPVKSQLTFYFYYGVLNNGQKTLYNNIKWFGNCDQLSETMFW